MNSIASFLETEALARIVAGLAATADASIALTDSAGVVLAESGPSGHPSGAPGPLPWHDGRLSDSTSQRLASIQPSQGVVRHPDPDAGTVALTVIAGSQGPVGAIVAAENASQPNHRLDDLLLLAADLIGRLCQQGSDLHKRIDDLAAISSVAGLVSTTTDLPQILDTAAEQIRRVMRVRASSIRLIDPETGELRISAVSRLSDAYLAKGPIKLKRNPIDEAAVTGQVVYIEDMATDPRTLYPAEARSEGIASCLVAGMLFGGDPIGVIRVYSDHVQSFSAFDESLLRTMASQLAAAIHTARLYDAARDEDRYAHQLAHARDVQRRMIPASAPVSDRIELGHVYHPSLALGGDLCDFIELPHGNLGVAVADVVGKGIAAALMMASVRSALRAHARSIIDIDEIMRHVNRGMCRDTLPSEFATVFYGVFSADESVLTYCNAGHELPYLVRDGQLTELESSGMAIGIDPEQEYLRHRLHLQPDDVLVIYTDGAPDATSYDGELFGRSRLRESILKHVNQPAEMLARNVLMDIQRFIGLAQQSDDVTLVVGRYRGSG